MFSEGVIQKAKATIGPFCKVCKHCDGMACKGVMPGPGGKGLGLGFIRNYLAYRSVALEMNTLHDKVEPSTACQFFGIDLSLPVFAAPIGAVQVHYGSSYCDWTYSEALLKGCSKVGTFAWTGDGVKPDVFTDNLKAMQAREDFGIPTIKPWQSEQVIEKIKLAEHVGVPAIAMDIDAAGLSFLASQGQAVSPVSFERLAEIIQHSNKPFIVKGIMTPASALSAKKAGASAIVVSNHGGRVLDETPSSLSVLEEIRQAVGPDMIVFIDGGVRSGLDVFKAIALGANAVLIGRPFVTAIYGGDYEAVIDYLNGIKQELKNAMIMTGASALSQITREKVKWLYARDC